MTTTERHLPIPSDYEVQPLEGEPMESKCKHCGQSIIRLRGGMWVTGEQNEPCAEIHHAPSFQIAECGTCGLWWDDAKSTSMTPAPSGRCPFEYFHVNEDETEECMHCGRSIVKTDGMWIDPDAHGDDSMWAETCGGLETWPAEHEPNTDAKVLAHVLTDDELVFIETSCYVSHEEGTTVREALIGAIDGALWAQLEEPSDSFRALQHTMNVDSEIADRLFDKVTTAVADAIRKVVEDI